MTKTKTDIEILRQAAHEIRDDATIATRSVRPFLIAVADFLKSSGDDLAEAAGNTDWCAAPQCVPEALTIARAYLAEVSA